MITIIHGTDKAATRNQLQDLKKAYKEIITHDGAHLDLTFLTQSLESKNMFAEERLVVIENFFAGKAKRDHILNYLLESDLSFDLVFWEDKESQSRDITFLATKARIIKLNINPVIFKFLDSLIPGNQKESLDLLNKTLESVESEIVLFMLIKQIRYLLLALSKSVDYPSDFKRLMSWQSFKLTKTASLFKLETIRVFYQRILDSDYKHKIGLKPGRLSEDIKFLTFNFLS